MSDMDKHKMTAKHKMVKNGIKNSPLLFECICGKAYKYQPGLSRHKQQCATLKQQQSNATTEIQTLIEEQQRHHIEQEKKIDELTQKISNMSLVTNNNTTNKFNLNFFLNNQCKDAIDFQTFLKQIKIEEEDLFYFGNHGYLNGMMNIIDKSLGSLEVHERPIHCTDVKRQIMYFKKEDGSWEKDKEKRQMRRLITTIDNKSYYCLEDWEDGKQFRFEDMDSPNFKWYLKVATETMGGDYAKDDINLNKMLNYLATEFYIKKNKKITQFTAQA
jgi:ribosomal protein S25